MKIHFLCGLPIFGFIENVYRCGIHSTRHSSSMWLSSVESIGILVLFLFMIVWIYIYVYGWWMFVVGVWLPSWWLEVELDEAGYSSCMTRLSKLRLDRFDIPHSSPVCICLASIFHFSVFIVCVCGCIGL